MYIPNSKLSRKKREKNNNKEKIKTLLISTEDLPATSTKPISFFFPHGEIQWENETRGRDERNKREERRERATKLISIKRNSA